MKEETDHQTCMNNVYKTIVTCLNTTEYTMDYKSRLMMYTLEINDIIFCVSSLKSPSAHFDIRKFVTFSKNSTRSGAHRKMVHVGSTNLTTANAYFMRLPRIDLEQSIPTIKAKLTR